MGTVFKFLVAGGVAWFGIKFGVGMLRGMGRPLPPPPPPGELRRVSVRYRCSVCGLEIKATLAQVPESICELGDYWCYWHGAGGYSGVALHLRSRSQETAAGGRESR